MPKKIESGLPKLLYASITKGGNLQSDEEILNVVECDGEPCTYGIYELKRIAKGRVIVEVREEVQVP